MFSIAAVLFSPASTPCRRAWVLGMAALCMAALSCAVTQYAEADTVRTRVGVGYNGKVMGLDAKGLLIDHAGAVRTIPRDDIVRLELDQYPDLGKAEVLFDRGVAGAGDAERLYTAVLGADPPQWLRAFIAWRLFRVRLGASRQLEALDAYLALVWESPEFAEELAWPAVAESDTDRRRAMLAKVNEALAKVPPEPVARELTKLRNALSPEPQVPPGPSTPDVPGPQSQTPGVSAETAEKAKREGADAGARGFLGLSPGDASKIVFVVDRSGSMADSIVFVKYELKRSIRELGPEKQFHVIFYSSGPALEMPARRLVSATDANKQEAFKFIDSVIPQGETDPSDALARAFAAGPELIYLLSDGEFDKAIVDQVAKSNAGKKVTVHTIGFLYKAGEKILKDIAAQNNGTYRFVAESDLETLLDQNGESPKPTEPEADGSPAPEAAPEDVAAKEADDRRWNRDYGVLYRMLEQKWQSLGTERDTSVQRETRIKKCAQWARQQFLAQSVEWPGEIGNIWVGEDKAGAKRVYVDFTVGRVDGTRGGYNGLLTNLQPRDAPNIPKGSGAVLCARIADIAFRGGIQVSIGNSVSIRLRR